MRCLVFLILLSPAARAGFVEFGGSANYRASNYDRDNYVRSTSYTGSVSYYFWEMCALEFNYTNGYSRQVAKGSSVNAQMTKIEDTSTFAALDVVLSAAERDDLIRPYLKLGGGYLMKQRYRRVDLEAKERLSNQEGLVPSAGAGVAIGLTQNLNLKLGLDAWSSPLRKDIPFVIDYAGRAGAAWIF